MAVHVYARAQTTSDISAEAAGLIPVLLTWTGSILPRVSEGDVRTFSPWRTGTFHHGWTESQRDESAATSRNGPTIKTHIPNMPAAKNLLSIQRRSFVR